MNHFIQGITLGVAYLAPIGMQNLFLINSALSAKSKTQAYLVALIVIFFDISLALASFYGVGIIIDNIPFLQELIFFLGGIIVIYIGYGLIKHCNEHNMDKEIKADKNIINTIYSAFIVTWFNPQALIDATLLFSSFRVSLKVSQYAPFMFGVMSASVTWFLGLTTLILIFSNIFSTKILKYLNIGCGSIIIFYGIKLIYSFFNMFL